MVAFRYSPYVLGVDQQAAVGAVAHAGVD